MAYRSFNRFSVREICGKKKNNTNKQTNRVVQMQFIYNIQYLHRSADKQFMIFRDGIIHTCTCGAYVLHTVGIRN